MHCLQYNIGDHCDTENEGAQNTVNPSWSRPTKYLVAVSLIAFSIFVLYISRTVLPFLIIAGLIAFFVQPLIDLLTTRLRFRRGLAVVLTYLLVLLLLPMMAGLLLIAVTEAANYVLGLDFGSLVDQAGAGLTSLRDLVLPIPALDSYIDQLVNVLLGTLSGVEGSEPAPPPSLNTILSTLGSSLSFTFGALAGVVGSIFSGAVLFIFVMLSSLHITLGARSYHTWFLSLAPTNYQGELTELLRRIGQVWKSFLRGQVTLMLIIGVIVWLGLTLLGVPGALSLAIVAGLLEILPNIGPVIATIPAVLVALLQGSSYLPVNNLILTLLVIVFYIVVQQLENALIVPRVLGEAVDLPAIVVMAGVLVGGSVAGILGALLATPVIATTREIMIYIRRKLLGEQPFPPKAAPEGQPAAAKALPVVKS